MKKTIGVLYLIIIIFGILFNIGIGLQKQRVIKKTLSGSALFSQVYIKGGSLDVYIIKDESLNNTYMINTTYNEAEPPIIYVDKGILHILQSSGSIILLYKGGLEMIYGWVSSGEISLIAVHEELKVDLSMSSGEMSCHLVDGNYSVNLYVESGGITLEAIDSRLTGYVSVKSGWVDSTIKTNYGGYVKVEILKGSLELKYYGFQSNITRRDNGYSGYVYNDGLGLSLSIKVVRGSVKLTVIEG